MGPNPGTVDVVTKSGGNHLQGRDFAFVRSNQMQARDSFNVSSTGAQVPPRQHHVSYYNFDFSGPILRDNLFYFFTYEAYRRISSAPQNTTTPTAAMFGGDFSNTSTVICDPTTYDPTTGLRRPFNGNTISDRRITAASKALLNYYTPGTALTVFNLVSTPKSTHNDTCLLVTLLHNEGSDKFQYAVVSQVISVNDPVSNVQRWDFDIQHTFHSKYLIDAAYLGNAPHRLSLNPKRFDCSSVGPDFFSDSNNSYFPRTSIHRTWTVLNAKHLLLSVLTFTAGSLMGEVFW